MQHEALTWDCPRTCLAVWPPWLCWLVAWSLDFEPPGVSRRWRWWDSLGPIVAQTELGWWQRGRSAFAACPRNIFKRSPWFLVALSIFENGRIFVNYSFKNKIRRNLLSLRLPLSPYTLLWAAIVRCLHCLPVVLPWEEIICLFVYIFNVSFYRSLATLVTK